MNFSALFAPIKIDIGTNRLVGGEYVLMVVTVLVDSSKKGVQQLPFTVRTKPVISVDSQICPENGERCAY